MIIAFILSLLLILSTVASSIASIAVGPVVGYEVTEVYDGDTFWVREGTKIRGKKIRIAGADSPEKTQPMGPEARDALTAKIGGKIVQLGCHGKSYDRDVCTVHMDGKDIAAWLVENGLAYDYPKYSKGAYREQEDAAKAAKLGVWKDSKDGGKRPWDFRPKKKKPVIKKMAGFFNKRKRNQIDLNKASK